MGDQAAEQGSLPTAIASTVTGQVDFGFADVWLHGELTKVALFVMTLPYSDAIFMQAFPREGSAPNRSWKAMYGRLSSLPRCRRGSTTTAARSLSGRSWGTGKVR